MRHLLFADVEYKTKSGLVIIERGLPNLFHDEGEKALLSAYFDTDLASFGAPPANLYMGLRSGSLAEADTIASLTEVSGTSYARQALSTTTGFTLSTSGGDWRATSGNAVFTAGGAWTAATSLFLCTVISGTVGNLISSIALSTSRTLANTETLTVSMYTAISE